jgi:carboxylesterase
MKDKINIWKFQISLSKRLLIWAAGSTLAGLVLVVFTSGFWNGFGIQALAWGVIDALIAVFGLWMSRRRRRSVPDAEDPALTEEGVRPSGARPSGVRPSGVQLSENRKLRRTLWINTGLDLLYITGGIVLAATLGRGNPAWRGHGWGIILQGAFLFFFDLIHAQSVPPALVSQPLQAFNDPAHQPFFLAAGSAAALLVHGFPGTPAEMRPLAETLHEQGWTVQGILLPGFGSQFAEILQRGYGDWLEAVGQALQLLKQKYSPVLLIGYSLGGALSIGVTAGFEPDGLVLLSPFWRLGTPLQRLIGTVLRPFLPSYFRPLQKADLADPKLQRSLQDFFPDIDLNDPEARAWLRDLQVPISVIDQIMKTGKQAYRSARSIGVPTLVVQGAEDELVRPQNTQKLVERLASADGVAGNRSTASPDGIRRVAVPPAPARPSVPTRYLEIPGGHNIIEKNQPGWDNLEQALIEFARSVHDAERKHA